MSEFEDEGGARPGVSDDGRVTRRRFAGKVLAAGISLSALDALVACGSSKAPAKAGGRGGTLKIAYTAELDNLDPHTSPGETDLSFFQLVYSTLMKSDKDVAPVPDLAESYRVSQDGLTYTFKLRPNLKFSNGKALTSKDVKATFDRILDPKTVAVNASNLGDVHAIEAPDAGTVVFRLRAPNASLPVALTQPNSSILSADLIASKADFGKIENAIGSGPFKVDKWVPDSVMDLSRNPHFYEPGKPYADKVKVSIIPNADTLIAAIKTGAIDFTWSLDPRVGKLAKSGGLAVAKTGDLNRYQLLVQTDKPPFTNQKLRTAVSYALDRDAIIQAAALGDATPVGPVGALSRFALPTSEFPSWTHDPAKAKQLLAEAGDPSGFRFTLLTQTSDPDNAPTISQTVQSQLKAVGIDANVKIMEFASWVEHWKTGDYQMAPAQSEGAADPDILLYQFFHSKGGRNFVTGNWNTPELDKLLDQGRATTDFAKRKAIYDQAQRILVDGLPMLWLYAGYLYSIMSDRVQGFVPRSDHSLVGLRDVKLSQ
jgi:peptide/nickel transport system substrate-binding protein